MPPFVDSAWNLKSESLDNQLDSYAYNLKPRNYMDGFRIKPITGANISTACQDALNVNVTLPGAFMTFCPHLRKGTPKAL